MVWLAVCLAAGVTVQSAQREREREREREAASDNKQLKSSQPAAPSPHTGRSAADRLTYIMGWEIIFLTQLFCLELVRGGEGHIPAQLTVSPRCVRSCRV